MFPPGYPNSEPLKSRSTRTLAHAKSSPVDRWVALVFQVAKFAVWFVALFLKPELANLQKISFDVRLKYF